MSSKSTIVVFFPKEFLASIFVDKSVKYKGIRCVTLKRIELLEYIPRNAKPLNNLDVGVIVDLLLASSTIDVKQIISILPDVPAGDLNPDDRIKLLDGCIVELARAQNIINKDYYMNGIKILKQFYINSLMSNGSGALRVMGY